MRGTSYRRIASSSAPVESTCELSASGSEDSSGMPARWITASGRVCAIAASTATGSVQSTARSARWPGRSRPTTS